MKISVDVLMESSLLLWGIPLLMLQLSTITCEPVYSSINTRHNTSKRSTDNSVEVFNSKQVEDLPSDTSRLPAEHSGEDLDQLLKTQQKPSSKIITAHLPRSSESHKINKNDVINRAIEDVYNSEDTSQQYNAETYVQLKYPSTIKPYEQTNSPLKIIVSERPQKTEKELKNYYFEPLIKYLGNNRNSEEVIDKIISTGRDNIGSEVKGNLKNAYLTKFTSYNITHLSEDKHNESFLLEKRDNSSSDIRYLDSKNRFTNYSDLHSSLLKTVLDPDHLTPSRTFLMDNVRDKLQGDSESIEGIQDRNIKIPTKTMSPGPNDFSDDTFTKKASNRKTEISTNLHSGIKDNDNTRHYVTEIETDKPSQHFNALNEENIPNTPVDFVGGQFMMRQDKPNVQTSDFPQPYYYQKGPNEFIGGQYIEEPQNKVLEKSGGPEVQNNFVGGQLIDFGGKDNMFGDITTDIVGDNNVADFVGGQFIKNVEAKSSLPSFDVEDYPINFVGEQFVDDYNSTDINETNEYVNKQDRAHNFIHEKMETESIDSTIETTTILDLKSISEFETSDLSSENNFSQTYDDSKPYLHDEKDTTGNNEDLNSKNTLTIKDMYLLNALLQNKFKGFDLNDKDKKSTLYTELYPTPLGNEYFKSYYNSNGEERKGLPITYDNNQSKFKNEESTTVSQIKKNYNGAYDVISILGIPQAKNNNTTEEQDKYSIPVMKRIQNNNNYRNVYTKNKITLPYSRSKVLYDQPMSSYSRLYNRPINVYSGRDQINEPKITNTANNWNLSPSLKDNVVFKTIDGDTEVIISVSNSPDDKLQGNNTSEHDYKESDSSGYSLGRLSTTKKPMYNTDTENANSEYDEYLEDDTILGSSNVNVSHSILEKDPDSKYYVTELVANYFTNQLPTEPSNIKDIVNSYIENPKRINSALPVISDVTNDYIVGESSDLYMNNLDSESATSSSLLFNERSNHPKTNVEPTVFPENLSDKSSITDDVELYAGSPFQTNLNIGDKPSENTKSARGEAIDDRSEPKSHLSELCIPLTNEKYISLLDLLSGPFYLDKNGKKIAMSLRGDRKKNCTLSSKQCKLFVDLKDISSSLNTDSSIDNNIISTKIKHEKRNVAQELPTNKNSTPHPKVVFSKIYSTEFGLQTNENKLTSDRKFSNTFTESTPILQPQLKNVFHDSHFTSTYKGDSNQNQEYQYISHLLPTVAEIQHTSPISNKTIMGRPSLFPMVNGNWIGLYNDNHRSGYHNPTDPHKNRPARTVDFGRSNEGEKCGCGENEILKSPSPFPNYKQFVSKRADILKNIVYTVNDWGNAL